MEMISENMHYPLDCNIILGQVHFINSLEDLYDAMVKSVPDIKFGIAFKEASGPCLVRKEDTDNELIEINKIC